MGTAGRLPAPGHEPAGRSKNRSEEYPQPVSIIEPGERDCKQEDRRAAVTANQKCSTSMIAANAIEPPFIQKGDAARKRLLPQNRRLVTMLTHETLYLDFVVKNALSNSLKDQHSARFQK